jgi:hypothetical protein
LKKSFNHAMMTAGAQAMHIRDIDFSDLSSAEKILLAQHLLHSSFDTGFLPSQIQEMEARMHAADSGQMKRIPWEEARTRLGLQAQ